MKKILFFFLTLILFLIIFNNSVLQIILNISLEKITEKKVKIDSSEFNLKKRELLINNFKVQNDSNFYFENIFSSNKIIVKFNPFNLFSDTIILDEIIFFNPILSIEISKNKKILKDNISVLEKRSETYKPKIYPKKKIDRNVIVKKIKIIDPKGNLIFNNKYKFENLNLSNMKLTNIGTSTEKSTHFKKFFELILTDLYLKIPNHDIKSEIKNIYKIKN